VSLLDPIAKLAIKRLSQVKNVILIGSGKGGVGKSVIAAGLAASLSKRYEVGVLDLDIHGPTIPLLLGLKKGLKGGREGIKPIMANKIKVMSIAFLIGERPLPLVGDEKSGIVLEFLANIDWGALSYLIVDLPPGMGDEMIIPLRIFRKFRHGFVIVTIPSKLAISVARRLLKILRGERVNVLGLIENMYDIYPSERGRTELLSMLKEFNLSLLGRIPYDPHLEEVISGRNLKTLESSKLIRCVNIISKKIESSLPA